MSFTKQQKLDRLSRSMPKVYQAGANPVITALLEGFAGADAEISQQIDNTRAQLFVRTAEGKNLDKLANSLGVDRPVSLGLSDSVFQELIPNLSLKAKQVRKAFYDTADVFWGPLFSRTNIQSVNAAPFNILAGDVISIMVDNNPVQNVRVLNEDIAISGNATALEMQTILSRIDGVTVNIISDSLTGLDHININTNTPGPVGSLTILTSTMISTVKLDLPLGKTELRQQDQRVMIYEIRPNEIVIEIPAVVPALRRTLRGSHHFHADSTLAGPVAPADGIWQGSFLFDPNGTQQTFTVTGQNAQLTTGIQKNNVYTSISVDDTSKISSSNGVLVFGWGTERQEQPVKFRGVPNSRTILVDPSYIFKFDHPIDDYVNVISDLKAFRPAKDGSDLAIYLTSPAGARAAVQTILQSLAAAGIIVNFIILAPKYLYLLDNPYISEDDAPGTN